MRTCRCCLGIAGMLWWATLTILVLAFPTMGQEDDGLPLGAIFELAVNCGSAESYTDVDGVVFVADTFHAANRDKTSRPISDTEDPVLYQTTAWSRTGIVYDMPLAETDEDEDEEMYLVELHFAEIWEGAFGVGLRTFDVFVEGKEVARDLDVFAAAGPLAPLILTVEVLVQDGSLTIELEKVKENPKINAFAVWRLGSLAPPITSLLGPSSSFSIVGPGLETDPLMVTVTFVDDVGVDVSSLSVADLLFVLSDGVDVEVLSFAALPLSDDGKTLSATWNVRPVGGSWKTSPSSLSPTLEIRLLADAVLDVNGNGNLEESASTSVSFLEVEEPPMMPSSPGPVFVRAVNCGGPEYTSRDDIVYEADAFDNGKAYSVTDEIELTSDDPLYQSERWRKKGFTYHVPVDADADYLVVMEFAEIFHGSSGKRLFGVQVEGMTVETELDVFDRAGGKFQALTLETEVRVSDGSLNITTIPIKQNPQMAAFSVWRLPSGLSPGGGPPTVPTLSPAEVAFTSSSTYIDTTDVSVPGEEGSARLDIMKGENRVQRSNFNGGSFVLRNTGLKRIAAVFIDVTLSIIPDIVFDHDGTGGDSVAKPLVYDEGAAAAGALPESNYDAYWLPARGRYDHTEEFDATALDDENNLFVDATSNTFRGTPASGGGFRGLLLLFDDFDPDELVRFSLDMDPNSLAGLDKASVKDGSAEVTSKVGLDFDSGGVSGAEMMCGVVTVLYGDGSQAEGTIASDGSQAGAVAVILNGDLRDAPGLTVGGLEPGEFGFYGVFRPVVQTTALPGDRVRVIMMKAMDPVGNVEEFVANGQISVDDLVAARLNATFPDFNVNNAVEVQNKIVTIPDSGVADLSALFRYNVITEPRDAVSPFEGHDTLALAFVAVIIDGKGRPLSFTTEPIRLLNRGGAVDGFT